MSSYPIRDPQKDHLITPQNSVLVIIDYQPTQVNSVNSMPKAQLIDNIVTVARLCVAFKVPVILSTVNVATGANKDTIPRLAAALPGVVSYDRTIMNSWEDKEFNEAVKKVGRKKLIMTALWTEVCLAFPSLDAMLEGFEVYPVVDAVGGTSVIAHETGLRRVEQAGAKLTTVVQLACELQRDWNRHDTAPYFVKALTEAGAFLAM
jgi:nicotinamidase-related amidase